MFSYKLDHVTYEGIRKFHIASGCPLNCNMVIVEDEDSIEIWVVEYSHTAIQTFDNLVGQLYTSHRKLLYVNPHGSLRQEAAG